MFSHRLASDVDIPAFTTNAHQVLSQARDIEDARMLITDAAETIVEQAVGLKTDTDTGISSFLHDAFHAYHQAQQQENKHSVWYSPNSFSYLLAPTEAGTLIRTFTSNPGMRVAFAQLPEVEPFNFSRHEDAPDGFDAQQWAEHQQMCQRIYESTKGRWSDNGETFEVRMDPWIDESLLASELLAREAVGASWPTRIAMADLVMREHTRRHGAETVTANISRTISEVMDVVDENDGEHFLLSLLPPWTMEMLTGSTIPEIDRIALDKQVRQLADHMPRP